ncbi:MAG TPA: DNA-processing protein DprA, partial [Methylovirgula sp.]
NGAAVSEMPFDWEARGRDFPRRNRIISGLANGVVIVEAAQRSGSLITARFAAEQGREIFAVPGSPLDPRAEGANDLIRNGATLCTCADDVVEGLARQIADPVRPHFLSENPGRPLEDHPLWDELDLPDVPRPPNSFIDEADADHRIRQTHQDDSAQARLIALLGPAPVSIDELARVANLSMRETRAILMEPELSGRLTRSGGDLISLTAN